MDRTSRTFGTSRTSRISRTSRVSRISGISRISRISGISGISGVSEISGIYRISWIAALLAAALGIVLTLDPRLYINGDNVDYMFMARAIRAGDLWPSERFPPLFPMLLAPVQAVFGMALQPQKILVLLLGLGSVVLLGRVVARRVAGCRGAWIFLAAALSIPFVEYSHYVMSEVPFFFFALGAIDLCDRVLRRPPENGAPSLSQFLRRDALRGQPALWGLAAWIAAAFYTRSAGVTLLAAVPLSLLLSGRRRPAAAVALRAAVLALPWLIHSLLDRGGGAYFTQLLQVNPYYPEFGFLTPERLFNRVRENALYYFIQQVPVTVMPAAYRSTYSEFDAARYFYPWWMSAVLLLPLAAGLWSAVRKGDAGGLYVTATLVLCCLWPLIWAGSRFLVPVAPLLVLYWFLGVTGASQTVGAPAPPSAGARAPGPGKSRGHSLARATQWAVLVVLAFLAVRNLVFYKQETAAYPPEWRKYFQVLEWIGANTPPEAVVVDRKPGFVEFVAGRRAVSFPREKDPDRMLDSFRRHGATHVVLSSLPYDDIGRYLDPAIEQRLAYFTPLFALKDPTTYVLAFHPQPLRPEPPRPPAPSSPGP